MAITKDKVVVITGASSGIGEAAARKLAKAGAKIILAARREDRLKEIADSINQEGGIASYKTTDVTSTQEVNDLSAFAIEQYEKIDVWINNAGLMQLSPLKERKIDEWMNMVDINIKGVLNGIYAVLPYMRERKEGHIINVSSVAGHVVFAGSAVYSATKSAVLDISEGLRMEESPESSIRSTTISPGTFKTELSSHITDSEVKASIEKFEADFGADPSHIAEVIQFVIEQSNKVATNEIIVRPTGQRI